MPPPDPAFLERAWSAIGAAAARRKVAVILGTERVVDGGLLATAAVINADGTIAGYQDKVQIDPSEEGTYSSGSGRQVFQVGPLKFGIAICHEGWRYPETVRWAARRAHRVPPPFSPCRAWRLRGLKLRRPSELIPWESHLVPRRREHLLFRFGELRERRVADHLGRGAARRDAALPPTLRQRRSARRGHRHYRRYRPPRNALQIRLGAFPTTTQSVPDRLMAFSAGSVGFSLIPLVFLGPFPIDVKQGPCGYRRGTSVPENDR